MKGSHKHKSIMKWRCPKINRIALSPEQAVLQQCEVGGGWMVGKSRDICTIAGPGSVCNYPVRGVTGEFRNYGTRYDYPS